MTSLSAITTFISSSSSSLVSMIPEGVQYVIIAFIIYQIIFYLWTWMKARRFTYHQRHIVITGGTQGLGLCLAQQLYHQGASVTIMARREAVGLEALQAIDDYDTSSKNGGGGGVDGGRRQFIAASVTDEKRMQEAMEEASAEFGPIDILICNAGSACTGYFADISTDDIAGQMSLNYMGCVKTIKACLSDMMSNRQRRNHIVIVSSAAAMTSFCGFSAYAPSKFALRGLAESLRNELLPYNIAVHSCYPATMSTPGLEQENETKPAECLAIEAGEDTYAPHTVATSLLSQLRTQAFHLPCNDIGTSLLVQACSGMSPRGNAVLDAVMLPVIVIISVIYRFMWDAEVMKDKYESLRKPASASVSSRRSGGSKRGSRKKKSSTKKAK